MSIRNRLFVSFAAMIVIPLIATIAASFIIIYIYNNYLDINVGYKNLGKLAEIQYEIFKADGEILQNSSDSLLDKDFQDFISRKLKSKNTEMIVRKGEGIIFATKQFNPVDIEKYLSKHANTLLPKPVLLDGTQYMVKIIPIVFSKQQKGEVILLADLGEQGMTARTYFIILAGVFGASFLITNAVLTYIVSKSIIKPLKNLQNGAEAIQQGNLDYEITGCSNDELGELCAVYEQMRLKLKESINNQIKYDENRKELFSNISHDLKTPITSIKGYVEGILDGVADSPEKVEKYLKTIHSKACEVDSMIDDLLLYSKLDLKKVPFDFERTDICKFLSDCVSDLFIEMEKQGIEINITNQLKKSAEALVDRERLKRVILNIIDNAKKYMNKERGKIDIILRETDKTTVIEIRDNGPGIDEKDLPSIFDRFYRADSARSEKSGSGLGLAIAKQIVEGHEGRIWARSKKDEGTSIIFSLKKIGVDVRCTK